MPEQTRTSSRLLRWAPFGLVALVVAVAVLLIATDHWRRGATGLGGAAYLIAVLRLLVPERSIGILAVRGKKFDVTFSILLGSLLLAMVFWG